MSDHGPPGTPEIARVPVPPTPGRPAVRRSTGSHAPSTSICAKLPDRFRAQETCWRHPFGTVLEATHAASDRRVWLTVLHPCSAIETKHLRAARKLGSAVADLTSPGIVRPLGAFRLPEDRLALVTEPVPGRPLAELLNDGPLAPTRAIEILRQLCTILAEPHSLGLHHRGLSLASVMLIRNAPRPNTIVVTDFGLGPLLDANPTVLPEDAAFAPVAPEAVLGLQRDAREDVYLIGNIAYALLTGSPPFRTGLPEELRRRHAIEDPIPLLHRLPNGGIPAELAQWVHRCLAKDPDERDQDAGAAHARLREAQRSAGLRTPWDHLPGLADDGIELHFGHVPTDPKQSRATALATRVDVEEEVTAPLKLEAENPEEAQTVLRRVPSPPKPVEASINQTAPQLRRRVPPTPRGSRHAPAAPASRSARPGPQGETCSKPAIPSPPPPPHQRTYLGQRAVDCHETLETAATEVWPIGGRAEANLTHGRDEGATETDLDEDFGDRDDFPDGVGRWTASWWGTLLGSRTFQWTPSTSFRVRRWVRGCWRRLVPSKNFQRYSSTTSPSISDVHQRSHSWLAHTKLSPGAWALGAALAAGALATAVVALGPGETPNGDAEMRDAMDASVEAGVAPLSIPAIPDAAATASLISAGELTQRGDAAAQAENLAEAMTLYQRAIVRDPQHLGALMGLGRLEMARSNFLRAAQYFKRAIAAAPNDRAARVAYEQAVAKAGTQATERE